MDEMDAPVIRAWLRIGLIRLMMDSELYPDQLRNTQSKNCIGIRQSFNAYVSPSIGCFDVDIEYESDGMEDGTLVLTKAGVFLRKCSEWRFEVCKSRLECVGGFFNALRKELKLWVRV